MRQRQANVSYLEIERAALTAAQWPWISRHDCRCVFGRAPAVRYEHGRESDGSGVQYQRHAKDDN